MEGSSQAPIGRAGMRRPGRLRAMSSKRCSPITHRRTPFRIVRGTIVQSLAFVSTMSLFLVSKIFCNWAWHTLQLATLCHSALRLLGPKFHVYPPGETAFLQSAVPPVATLTITRPLIQWIFPDLYRTARFWRRLIPIYTRYMITKLHVRRKSREERDKIWAKRHEWGGKMVHQLVLDMSGFYVKSAQILASKADFVPGAWRKWLSKHLDDAPPRPFVHVKRSIEKELALCVSSNTCTLLDAVFSIVEHEPIAAASIAQVHGATLVDGRQVVVKVQHLGMDTIMHSDLRNLARVARFVKGQLPVDLTPIVKEIQATIPLEFNFEYEVWFMLQIKTNLGKHGFTSIVCPSPIENLCTRRLIVMERLYGIPFTHILHRDADGSLQARVPQLRSIVRNLIDAYGQMLLIDGVFHADPHAGNLLLLTDGRLGLLDYGQSKVLGDASRKQLARMVASLARGDDDAAAQVLCEMGILFGRSSSTSSSPEVDVQILALMARMLFDTCYVEEATVSPMADNSILRKVPMKSFNQELWLVVRTVLILRGLLFSLDMDVSAVAIWRKYAESVK